MNCTRCGNELPAGAATCPNCGMTAVPPPPLPGQPAVPPPPVGGQPQGSQVTVPDNMILAVLATALCCVPLGVVAIVYASKVNNLARAGDLQGAQQAANAAKTWSIIAIVGGAVGVVIYGVVMALVAMADK